MRRLWVACSTDGDAGAAAVAPIVESGAAIDAQRPRDGKTALMIACSAGAGAHVTWPASRHLLHCARTSMARAVVPLRPYAPMPLCPYAPCPYAPTPLHPCAPAPLHPFTPIAADAPLRAAAPFRSGRRVLTPEASYVTSEHLLHLLYAGSRLR